MSEKIAISYVKDGKRENSHIEIWEYEEKKERENEVRIDFIYYNSIITKYADNYFEALIELRKELENLGIQLLCKGCCKTVYPSAMLSNMGSGKWAYILSLGKQASKELLVDIFESCEESDYASIEEQNNYFVKWTKSLKG